MKLYRIFAYAAVGIITGLIIENQALACKQACAKKQLLKKEKELEEAEKAAA